jgi:nicotinamide-nucleotide amidase
VEIEFTKIDEAIVRRAAEVMALAKRRNLTLITAESCSGGLLGAVPSEAPGAGDQLQGALSSTPSSKSRSRWVSPRHYWSGKAQ